MSRPSIAAAEYRETQEAVQNRQTEFAITGTKIAEASKDMVEGLTTLETAIAETPALGDQARLSWLSQVQVLRSRAEGLQVETETLNRQLTEEREQTNQLMKSFNKYENGNVMEISLKNGEIAELKQQVADRTLEAEQYRGRWASYLWR